MHLLRTRFAGEVVAEFLPPKRQSNKVVIFCDGLPSVPAKSRVLNFFHSKNYWVFHPRYRGTWESGGKFLQYSPEKDIEDVINGLSFGFLDTWGGRKYCVHAPRVYVIGSSFGGTVALLASRNPKIEKVVALCPVIDWGVQRNKRNESLDEIKQLLLDGYGGAYRFSNNRWNQIGRGKFLNPLNCEEELDGNKILLIHSKDDDVVPWKPGIEFAKRICAKNIVVSKGGHLSSSYICRKRAYAQTDLFFHDTLVKNNLDDSICFLKKGGVGVIATDTIYGIVGLAFKKDVVESIYKIKRRNKSKPLIILISDIKDIKKFSVQLNAKQINFLKRVWPGRTSVIIKCSTKKFYYLHRGTEKLAYRVPKNKKLISLIKKVGPLVAPSANIEGDKPANNIKIAQKYFGNTISFYIEGKIYSTKPSTLVDLTKNVPVIIRRGSGIKNI